MSLTASVSVVIRAKNEARFIGEALDAIFDPVAMRPRQVVVVDSGEQPSMEFGANVYVGTVSEYDSGKRAGERLAKEGILKVVCINHEVGNVSLDQRCEGLNDGLKPTGGGTEVVAVTPDPADIQRRTEAYLSSHPDVQAVFAMGAGAAVATRRPR